VSGRRTLGRQRAVVIGVALLYLIRRFSISFIYSTAIRRRIGGGVGRRDSRRRPHDGQSGVDRMSCLTWGSSPAWADRRRRIPGFGADVVRRDVKHGGVDSALKASPPSSSRADSPASPGCHRWRASWSLAEMLGRGLHIVRPTKWDGAVFGDDLFCWVRPPGHLRRTHRPRAH